MVPSNGFCADAGAAAQSITMPEMNGSIRNGYSTPFFTWGTPSLIHFGSGLSIR